MKRTIGAYIQLMEALSTREGRNSVDGLICGDPERVVTGVAVVFSATQSVLAAADAAGANLIIAHEGPYYSHHPGAAWLETDAVYHAKRQWIEERGLAIWRNHDQWHQRQPDGITEGLVRALGCDRQVECYTSMAAVVTVPETTLGALASATAQRLGTSFVRYAGESGQSCRKLGVLAGYRGTAAQALPLIAEYGVDTIVAGEGPEWELPDYIADAVYQGRPLGLILLGHAVSEEPGMRLLAEELQAAVPDVPVRYIAGAPPLAVRRADSDG